jgi:ATP-dependent DNA helicase RecQ
VRARGHDRLPTFGVGTEFDRKGWQAVFRQMMGHDLVRPDPARHGALRADRGRAPDPARRGGDHAAQGHADHGRRRPAAKALVSEEDAPLLSALKAKRRALAEAARVPAYVIFTDRTLIEMAETRPQSLDEIARVSGVGAKARTLRRGFPRGHHRRGGGPGPSRAPQARRAGGGGDL